MFVDYFSCTFFFFLPRNIPGQGRERLRSGAAEQVLHRQHRLSQHNKLRCDLGELHLLQQAQVKTAGRWHWLLV